MDNRVESIEGQLAQFPQQQAEFSQSLMMIMAKQFEELKRKLNSGTQKGKGKQQLEK